MEEALAAGLGEGQIAQLVEDDEIQARELGGQSAGAALAGFLLEPVHQIDGVEVAAAPSRATSSSKASGARRSRPRTRRVWTKLKDDMPVSSHDVARA